MDKISELAEKLHWIDGTQAARKAQIDWKLREQLKPLLEAAQAIGEDSFCGTHVDCPDGCCFKRLATELQSWLATSPSRT